MTAKSKKRKRNEIKQEDVQPKSTSKNAKVKKKKKNPNSAEMVELYKMYLESSAEESELSEDAEWEEGDYEVDKIVDDSVDMCGNHRFQVAWKNWSRKSDGTNTTWVKPEQLTNADEALAEWKIEKKRRIIERRKRYEQTGYPLSLFAHGCFTRFNTTLEELGFGEDQELTPDMEFPSYLDTTQSNRINKVEETEPAAIVHTQIMGIDSNYSKTRERPSMSPSASVRPAKRLKIEKESVVETDRTVLQAAWDSATDQVGAARVVLVNEVDEELIPQSINLATFQYLELGPYRYEGDLSSDINFFAGCTCDDGCLDPQKCPCQDEHLIDLTDETKPTGDRVFAYDKNGKYRLDRGSVIECNAKCQCDLTCPNRVAQRPRDVPLEVFKTPDRGWAVRTTTFIEEGKVLGVFTGDLVPSSAGKRDKQKMKEKGADEFLFELDWLNQAHGWAVDAKNCGNWSRFINHSCLPNVKVYAVFYDSVIDAGEDCRHRLGFVTTRDIEPRTELMINYTPHSKPAASGKCCKYGNCIRFK